MIKSKKNKKSYKFPVDSEFRKKAAYIADKVMYAINIEGVKIANASPLNILEAKNIICPLGCLKIGEARRRFPFSCEVVEASNGLLTENDAYSFICGFECSPLLVSKHRHVEAMFELGKSYRERFCG